VEEQKTEIKPEEKKENSIFGAPGPKATLHQMRKFAQKLKRQSEWGLERAKRAKEQRREEKKARHLARINKIKQGNLKHERIMKCQTK